MTILEEARHSLSLLYSPGTDTFLEDMTRNADSVFYFDEGPRATTKLISKAYPKAQKSQTTLRSTLGRSSWKEQYQEKGKGDAYQITGLSFSVLYILSLGFISGNAL